MLHPREKTTPTSKPVHPISAAIRRLLAGRAVPELPGFNGPLDFVGARELVRDGALLVGVFVLVGRVVVGGGGVVVVVVVGGENGFDVVHGVVGATAGSEAVSAKVEEERERG